MKETKVLRVSYTRTFNLGNYENEKITIEMEVGGNVEAALSTAEKLAFEQHMQNTRVRRVRSLLERIRRKEITYEQSGKPLPENLESLRAELVEVLSRMYSGEKIGLEDILLKAEKAGL